MQHLKIWILAGLLAAFIFMALSAFAQEGAGQSLGDTEKEMQRKASIQMLTLVVGGLITTLVLLRWVDQRQKRGNLPSQDKRQPDDLVQRAMQALKEQEEQKKQKRKL